jgi:hypothetical protein
VRLPPTPTLRPVRPRASFGVGGYPFAVDPQLTAAQAAVFWRADVLPSVIPLVPTNIEGARLLAIDELGGVIVERIGVDGRHVIVRLDGGDLHFSLAGRADQPLAAVLPLNDDLPIRATAALRLWARMAEQPNQPEEPLALTRQRRDRLVLMVRALDGHLAEASYREIAEALFGTRRVERDTWKTSSLRDRTIRLVRGGIDLMRTGYRRLLRGR